MVPRNIGLFVLTLCMLAGSSEVRAQSLFSLPQQNVSNLTSLLNRSPVPARLVQLQGPDSLRVGEAGLFVAAANVETATLPLRIEWSFGDGTTAQSLSARHQYRTPGTYQVVFTVSNDGGTASDTLTVTVVPAPPTKEGAETSMALGMRAPEDGR